MEGGEIYIMFPNELPENTSINNFKHSSIQVVIKLSFVSLPD